MAKIISVLTSKGGVGKTETAMEVATILHDSGKAVLVIDLDGQRNCSDIAGADSKVKNIFDVLNADCVASDAIQTLKSFDMIAGSTKMSKADKFFGDRDDMFLLDDVCRNDLRDKYDIIVIDNPPARNILTDMSIIASDYALLVTDGSAAARQGIEYVVDDISTYKFDERHKWTHIEILGIILNKYKGRTTHFVVEEEAYRNVVTKQLEEKGLGTDIFVATVRDAVEAFEASMEGESLQNYKHYGNVATDFRKVTAEIVKRIG